jgi:DNA-binding protein H-NS
MASKKTDLSKLSLDDLKAMKKDVEKAIKDFAKRKRSEAMKEIQAVAKKHGISMDDIVGGKGKKAKAAPKYANPSNASETWSGRGRQPAWYKEALKAGKKPETMEI